MQTMIIWYFQQHTNRARDDRPPHHLPLLSRRRRNCSCLSFEKHICQLVSILCRNSSIIDILQYTWDWLIKLKLKQERVKILTLEAVLNVTNSNSGLEGPYGKINIEVWAKNLDVEIYWSKKKLKWLLILDRWSRRLHDGLCCHPCPSRILLRTWLAKRNHLCLIIYLIVWDGHKRTASNF